MFKSVGLFIFLIFGFFVLSGCKSSENADKKVSGNPKCVGEKNKSLIIRWGDYDTYRLITVGYQLTSDCKLVSVKKDINDKDYISEYIKTLDPDRYCEIIRLVTMSVVAVPTLNAPAEKVNFVEYINDPLNVYNKAQWNPAFNNKGNKVYKALFDTLMALVPQVK